MVPTSYQIYLLPMDVSQQDFQNYGKTFATDLVNRMCGGKYLGDALR